MHRSLDDDSVPANARVWDFVMPPKSCSILPLLSECVAIHLGLGGRLNCQNCHSATTRQDARIALEARSLCYGLAKPAGNHQRFASNPGGILRSEKDSGRRDILCLSDAAKWGLRFQLFPEIALIESAGDHAFGHHHSRIDGVNSNVAGPKLLGQRPRYGVDRCFCS